MVGMGECVTQLYVLGLSCGCASLPLLREKPSGSRVSHLLLLLAPPVTLRLKDREHLPTNIPQSLLIVVRNY